MAAASALTIFCVRMREEAVALLPCSARQKQRTRHLVFNQPSKPRDRNAPALAPHLRTPVLTHQDYEKQPQQEAQAYQQEGDQARHLLQGDEPLQLLGRLVIDQGALSGQR